MVQLRFWKSTNIAHPKCSFILKVHQSLHWSPEHTPSHSLGRMAPHLHVQHLDVIRTGVLKPCLFCRTAGHPTGTFPVVARWHLRERILALRADWTCRQGGSCGGLQQLLCPDGLGVRRTRWTPGLSFSACWTYIDTWATQISSMLICELLSEQSFKFTFCPVILLHYLVNVLYHFCLDTAKWARR